MPTQYLKAHASDFNKTFTEWKSTVNATKLLLEVILSQSTQHKPEDYGKPNYSYATTENMTVIVHLLIEQHVYLGASWVSSTVLTLRMY